MPRGGYQKPDNPAPVSGPGKFARRTDGQKIQAPDMDHPDLQYGDRSMLEDAQRRTPLKGSQGASVSSSRKASGAPATRGGIPPFLTGGDDPHPEEPTTTGLGMGAGAGPEVLDASQPSDDVKETVLETLALHFGNQDAARMLSEMRAEHAQAMPPSMPSLPSLGAGLPAEEAPTPDQEV